MNTQNNQPTHTSVSIHKIGVLVLSIIFDLIGMMTYTLPIFGEFFDLVWAPTSAILFFALYRGKLGMVGGVFSFFEEIIPGIDIIPSFTIAWFLKYKLD